MPTERSQTRKDRLIEYLFQCLPATSYAQIAERLTRRSRSPVSTATVGWLLAHLRANSDTYGWTVLHVKRGPNPLGDKRFISALRDEDGNFSFDESPETVAFVQEGLVSTVKHAATMTDNEMRALSMAMSLTRSRRLKARMKEVTDDLGYASRKCAALLAAIDNDGLVVNGS